MLFKSLPVKVNVKKSMTSVSSCLKGTWKTPEGHHTRVKLYNCVTRQNEPLIVQDPHAVTWYTCGPTVYDSAHIGHASCYVKLDIIQRILKEHFKLNIVSVMNITDIDNKIIKRAKENKVSCEDIAVKYEKEFWEDLASLKVAKPDFIVRVTKNMPLIIDFIDKLIIDRQAYVAFDGSVYFDVKSNFDVYGKLQNIGETFEDPNNKYKRAPMDFALWKSVKVKNEPFWESPWGRGRPGWHIECSALASNIFGNNIDIHAGGIDLRFPHHENEEIQSCTFHNNKQWVNYWIHIGHLHLKNSEKMSKSLKNTVSIQDMLKDSTADVFRLACAMSHYSSRIEFSKQWLESASNLLKTFKNFSATVKEIEKGLVKVNPNSFILTDLLKSANKDIDEAFCNDFNTPKVIEIICKIVNSCNFMIAPASDIPPSYNGEFYHFLALYNLVKNTLNLFNIAIEDSFTVSSGKDSEEFINMLVDFRQNVRELGLEQKNQDLLTICDKVRDSLSNNGVMVKDYGTKSSWST